MPAGHELKVMRNTHKQEILWDSGKVYMRKLGGNNTIYNEALNEANKVVNDYSVLREEKPEELNIMPIPALTRIKEYHAPYVKEVEKNE